MKCRLVMLPVALFAGVLLSGCGFFGGSSQSEASAPSAEQTEPAKPAKAEPAKDKKEKNKSEKKGAASEAQIKADLDVVGKKLVSMAANNVIPKESNKSVSKVGSEYVARYADVDNASVTTSMQMSKNGQYVGFIRYAERSFECRGKSKAEALKAPCEKVGTRRMNEMIRYDGKAWRY
jgi:hypothetical protein